MRNPFSTRSTVDIVAQQELLAKLRESGHGPFLEALLDHSVYTKGGRLKKTAACRALGCSLKQLNLSLAECRAVLGDL